MSDLQNTARAIFFETLRMVDLPTLIRRRIRRDGQLLWVDEKKYNLASFAEVVLIGVGKASLPMGYAVETVLGTHLTRGLLVSNRRESLPLKSEVIIGGHPLPDANSLRAGKRAIEILSNCPRDALVIFLISGGGSALFESLVSDEITLEDLQELNQILVECGATIEEINTIRKRFSAIKGGKLKNYMKAEKALAFLVSDVNAGDFKTLASNPIFPEASQPGQIEEIVDRYGLAERMPRLFGHSFDSSLQNSLPLVTSNAGKIETFLLGENRDVLEVAGNLAEEVGYKVQTEWTNMEESYEVAVSRLVSNIGEIKRANPGARICLVSGGEVACKVKGRGFGGRNQEFALYCALKLREAGYLDSIVLSCGTDGIDGRSIAAGAIAQTKQLADSEARIDRYFQSSDTAAWFAHYGGLIVTGPTGNNLRDLRVILIH